MCIRDHKNSNYLAVNEWGWVGYEELSKSRRVLYTEAKGQGG